MQATHGVNEGVASLTIDAIDGIQADVAIVNTTVFTADAARSWSDAVAVRGDRLIALGGPDVRARIGPDTEVIDAADGLVLPGFQDAHVHAPFAGLDRLRIDLRTAATGQQCMDTIAAYAAANPELEWICGGGWALDCFPGGTPTRQALDGIVPDRPVYLLNRDGHSAWVNTEALRRGGVDRSTPDPSDGRYDRDASGELTGCLHEGAAHSFNYDHVPPPSTEMWQDAILESQAYLFSLGITGWQDALVTPATEQAYQGLADTGRLQARVVGALWWDRHRGLEQIEELVERRRTSARGSYHPTAVKIMVDGVLENYTGALLEPYCGHRIVGASGGLTYVAPDLLSAAVTRLDALDFQAHVHAIGDRAVRMALDAVQAARAANGHRGNRHHIAHLELVHPDDLPRFRQLNVTANCQAFWAQHDPQLDVHTIPLIGAERVGRLYPFGDLYRSGATLAMGSDWGVTTADPLQQIEVAIRRVNPATRHERPLLPDQRLPLTAALGAFTAGSAYVNHDDDAGSIAVGRRADLTLLDRNVFEDGCLPADATVTHTFASGALVWSA